MRGEEVQWELLDRDELHLVRINASPAAGKPTNVVEARDLALLSVDEPFPLAAPVRRDAAPSELPA